MELDRYLWTAALLLSLLWPSPGWTLLTDSGQKNCYDTAGETIGCPGAGQELSGQDGAYHLLPPVFADNGDSTVEDRHSHLIWMKSDDTVQRTWQEAADYCESLEIGSYVNWRLPTFPELLSLVDYGTTRPAIHRPFLCQDNGGYWTATEKAADTTMAGAVHCDAGADYWLVKTARLYVRCVHDGAEKQGGGGR